MSLPSPDITSEDVRLYDDVLHKSLVTLEDFRHGPWFFRCVEFHFGRGIYPSGSRFGMHIHKEMQFEVPLSGLFEFSLEGEKAYQVKPGTTFFIPPETAHRWRCIQSGIMIGVLVSHVPSPGALSFAISSRVSGGILGSVLAAELWAGFLRELDPSTRVAKMPNKRLKAWVFLIVDELLTKALKVPEEEVTDLSTFNSRGQRIASHLMRYIEANIDGDLSLKNLGELVGLSSRQIQRIFTKITGDSCHKYVMSRRVEAGRYMLESDPYCSIKEIAYTCGFSSPAHFCVNFKKSYGVSPSTYKQ